MMRPSVQGVDPPVCCTPGCYCYICKRQLCGFPQCAASWMTYARDSFVDSQGGLLSSRGGGPDTLAQTHWHQSYIAMHQEEPRTHCTSIGSDNGSKDFIPIPNGSCLACRGLCVPPWICLPRPSLTHHQTGHAE